MAIGVLQLVALALPAFAILLQLVVESEKSYTKYAIPVTTAGFLLFIVGGIIVLGQLVLITTSTIFALALGYWAWEWSVCSSALRPSASKRERINSKHWRLETKIESIFQIRYK